MISFPNFIWERPPALPRVAVALRATVSLPANRGTKAYSAYFQKDFKPDKPDRFFRANALPAVGIKSSFHESTRLFNHAYFPKSVIPSLSRDQPQESHRLFSATFASLHFFFSVPWRLPFENSYSAGSRRPPGEGASSSRPQISFGDVRALFSPPCEKSYPA